MEKLFSTACTSSSSKFCNIFWYTNYLIVFLNGFFTKLFNCISKCFLFISQPGKGPGADHTNGTAKGRYAYMDTVMRTEGERARLYSQVFKASTDGKCSLRYYV